MYVEVGFEPGDELIGSADLVLEWVDAKGYSEEIMRREDAIHKKWQSNRCYEPFELGDWKILRGKAKPQHQQLGCPESGECRLRAVVIYRGERVKSAARVVYVQTDPPPPQKNPVTLSISAENYSAGDQKRIDHGQVLNIQINARNRTIESDTYYLTATFCDEIFARNTPIELEGTPAGDTSRKQSIMADKRQLLDPQQSAPMTLDGIQSLRMPETTGKYQIRAELADENGEVVANASSPVYFQRDPGRANSKLPFDIEQKVQDPMWELNEDLSILSYSGDYPLYKELQPAQRLRRALQGRLAFIAEISANGLLEWAMRPKEHGDDSNFDQLNGDSGSQDDLLWERYSYRLEKLGYTSVESPIEFAHTWRETVAIMLDIFQEEND